VKIILVDNLLLKRENNTEKYDLQPHLGLISLIAVLRNSGYEAELYDPKLDMSVGKLKTDKTLYTKIADAILEKKPDLVGFTSLGCNFICTVKIAGYIKKRFPKLPILLGGPHATVLHREILTAFTQFDVIVRNEAELKIVPVIEAIGSSNFEKIPGVTYRKNGEVLATPGDTVIEDLDQLPFPAYDKYPIDELGLSSLRVEAGRGCPFKCTFCSTATFFGRKYRLKSAVQLCAELDFLRDRYGITEFSLTHDLFTVNRHKVVEFCNEVMDRGYTWKCSARMDCVDPELLHLMKKAGCVSIYYGIETGSQRMQKISQKKLDLGIFKDTLATTLAVGMQPTVSFITGYPEEVKQDQDDTLDLIGYCYSIQTSIKVNIQLHLLTPEPGTALMQQYQDQLDFDNYITDFNFPTLEDDDSAVMGANPAVFMNHHYFKSVLPRERHIFVTAFFEILQPLCKDIIRLLIQRYENKLHVFADAVYQWRKKQDREIKGFTINDFISYVEETYAKNSYLRSLVMYMYQVFKTSTALTTLKVPVEAGTQKRKIKVSPNIFVLKNTHNCPLILERLGQRQFISRKLASAKTNLLVQLIEDEYGERSMKNYDVDANLTDLIEQINAKEMPDIQLSSLRPLTKAGILYYC
jgi:radical SAM superfamily enzyme YgiQ (UPF0313 family)